MSAPVDVLAVMDTAAARLGRAGDTAASQGERDGRYESMDELRAARAAVAELIDALQRIERITAPGESDPAQAFNMLAKIDCIATAALARVQS